MVRSPTTRSDDHSERRPPGATCVAGRGSVQFVGGIMIVFGLWTRLAALAFAAFCVATALLFHRNLASTDEMIQAGKDLAHRRRLPVPGPSPAAAATAA